VLLCNALTEGCWHDHTGHKNTHLSVGMAGALHLYAPSDAQIDATARVCAWAIDNPDIPLVDGIDKIKGHMDWYKTACPGWLDTGEGKPSGPWKPRLYNRIEELLWEAVHHLIERLNTHGEEGAARLAVTRSHLVE
jgi:hypothetical protein